uniref:Uncharacterized protein n=1 Tax=viral metagenome TaxID=1070528 RepID=A0A6C0C9V7_9ZZZZ
MTCKSPANTILYGNIAFNVNNTLNITYKIWGL